jgi:predicted DNA-binding transcriptional regulator AlpA
LKKREIEARSVGNSNLLSETAWELREARLILEGVETQVLVGVARMLAETAESLARTAERLEATRPTEWMDTKQTAAYLAGKTKDSFDKIMVTTDIPRHYITERGILFNRAEVDAWIMKRTSPPSS